MLKQIWAQLGFLFREKMMAMASMITLGQHGRAAGAPSPWHTSAGTDQATHKAL